MLHGVHLNVNVFTGPAMHAHLPDVASLRIRVFREFPYLYQGSQEYEENYLRELSAARDGVLVLAFDASRVVGASTGMPALHAEPAFREPLERAGFELSRVFYFGESVLLPEYRGRGIGHRFFDERERCARAACCDTATFAAVNRAADDPRRPHDYRCHEHFWMRRGYQKRPDVQAHFSWPEIGSPAYVKNTLTYWVRDLEPLFTS